MGITHHWYRPTELPEQQFADAVVDIEEVVASAGVALAGFEGEGNPIFLPDHVVFNGVKGQHCEPFEIRRVEFDRRGRAEVFGYCKTEQFPYDLCVKAALIILKHHLGDLIRVGSDASDEDWKAAKELIQSQLNFGIDFILDAED